MKELMILSRNAFAITDESGVVTVFVPGQDLEDPVENYASFTHVLTDGHDFSSHDFYFST